MEIENVGYIWPTHLWIVPLGIYINLSFDIVVLGQQNFLNFRFSSTFKIGFFKRTTFDKLGSSANTTRFLLGECSPALPNADLFLAARVNLPQFSWSAIVVQLRRLVFEWTGRNSELDSE